jgi:prepilin-type processing-associated H-X9-DG protein
MPSLAAARESARQVLCATHLRGQGQLTQFYLDQNHDTFPVRDIAATGGGSVFNAFLPSRTILSVDRRPVEILTCPDDRDRVRDYPVGDGTPAYPDSLGIGPQYGLQPDDIVRYSYGINNMTGINPTTAAEKLIFNPRATAYRFTSNTLLYADCAWVNARAYDKLLYDAPRLKGRVGNAAASGRMNVLADIPQDWGTPRESLRRHRGGSNVLFMDHHAEIVSQKRCFKGIIYSWTETAGGED